MLASNNERVLLPVNEPTVGSKRKSQILTYLEQHGGEGVQHIALKTDDVFATVHAMRVAVRARNSAQPPRAILRPRNSLRPRRDIRRLTRPVSDLPSQGAARCGFELMERPREVYYDNLKEKLGDGLTDAEVQKCRELGILADRDDQGVLLQIFTKPVGDRSTLFLEIIQRVGCTLDAATNRQVEQRPGCGGFGKGNFHELFRAIEEYETKAGINKL